MEDDKSKETLETIKALKEEYEKKLETQKKEYEDKIEKMKKEHDEDKANTIRAILSGRDTNEIAEKKKEENEKSYYEQELEECNKELEKLL